MRNAEPNRFNPNEGEFPYDQERATHIQRV
jgi:hypothetical protein